jgi:hypothetical protein
MTAQYWSRKLEGTYVWHGDKFKQITALRMDNEDPIDDRYPEQTLPFVRFQLDGGDYVERDAFEVRFPDEGYARVDDRAIFAGRTMVRAWKIAPNPENYRVGGGINMQSWLNAGPVEYDPPERLFEYKSDAIFTPKLAARTISNSARSLLYCDHPIAKVTRRDNTMTLNGEHGPDVLGDLLLPWAKQWGQSWDYEWPEGEKPDQLPPFIAMGGGLPPRPADNHWVELEYFEWRYRPVQAIDNWDFTWQGDHIKIMYEGNLWHIPHMREAVNCFGEDNEALLWDLFTLLKMYDILPHDADYDEEVGHE